MAMCTPSAIICDGPKALSLDQISFTFTGLLVTCSGGSLGGETRSRKFCHRTLYEGCQSTVMRDDTALGVGLNHSLKFSATPPPYSGGVKTTPLAFLSILIGRSVKKSLRLDIKPRERGFCAPPNRGAVVPSGNTTFGAGVPGSLHFGAIVLNTA